MYELLGQTTNEEPFVWGMILGFFEVMLYFQHELPLWKDAWKIKREFQHSIVRRLAGNVSRTTAHNRSVGHHEHGQAQTSATPDSRACHPRIQEEGNIGAFAPWDEMNVATKVTLRNVRSGDPIAIIYVPSATLALYGAGVVANGTFMVFDVIPFYEVKSIWIGKSNGGKRLEYEDVKRAYSKCVENKICPGFVDSSQESAAMFLQNVAKINERMPRQVPTICTTSKTWLIVRANCFGRTSWRSLMRRPTRSGTQSRHPE